MGAGASAGAGDAAGAIDNAADKDLKDYSESLSEEQRRRLVTALIGDSSLEGFLNESKSDEPKASESDEKLKQHQQKLKEKTPEESDEPKATESDEKLKQHQQKLKEETPEETMRRVLGNGDVKLVKPSWMLKMPDDWILQRRQDLPDAAFVADAKAPEYAAERPDGMMTVVSYGWFSKEHPDPKGFHVKRLRQFFRVLFNRRSDFALNMAGMASDFGDAFFMDFPSLPQTDIHGRRSDEELLCFLIGLSIINFLYGSQTTYVVQLKCMALSPFDGMNNTPYEDRGWCSFEETVSGIIKPKPFMLNLGLVEDILFDEDAAEPSEEVAILAMNIIRTAVGSSPPPVTPPQMEQILKTKNFTNGADLEKVAELYKKFFEKVSLTTTRLDLPGPFAPCSLPGQSGEPRPSFWGKHEAHNLSEALPSFTACESLYFCSCREFKSLDTCFGHPFGDDGLCLLAPAIAKMSSLTTLALGYCEFGEKGLAALQEAATASKSLRRISLPRALESTKAGVSMSKAWEAAGKDSIIWDGRRSSPADEEQSGSK